MKNIALSFDRFLTAGKLGRLAPGCTTMEMVSLFGQAEEIDQPTRVKLFIHSYLRRSLQIVCSRESVKSIKVYFGSERYQDLSQLFAEVIPFTCNTRPHEVEGYLRKKSIDYSADLRLENAGTKAIRIPEGALVIFNEDACLDFISVGDN